MERRRRLRIAVAVSALASAALAAQVPGRDPLPPGTGSISGRVVDAQSGEPLANVAVGLAALRSFGGNKQTTTDEAQGDSEPLVAAESVELLDDTADLALLLQEAGRISGRVVPERGGLPPLTGVRVAAKWTDEGEEINPLASDDVEVGPDGSFRIDGLFGLRSIQLLGLPPEWRIQSIQQNRNEIPAAGVTVTSGTTFDLVITLGRR